MRSGTTAAKDYMEVHEAMSSGSVMLTLSQKHKKLFEFKSEGRKEGGMAPFVRLICIDGESTALLAPAKMCSVSRNWFSVHFGSSGGGGGAAAAAVIYEN